MNRVYVAIDLKSFYASVECVERGLDPLNTNLVVADLSRTNKTICLAVSPSLKSYGLSGRPRLYEVEQLVNKLNKKKDRQRKSYVYSELKQDPSMAIDYIVATPQMRKYLDYSRRIYEIYLNYVSQEDIHVYSIDEVFIDVTAYLNTYQLTAHELALKMIRDVLSQTGVTATCGIGSNLYLAKVAMDIEAKHMQADKDGVRIAELDEMSYRHHLWDHEPLTDFWRVGRGYAARLAKYNLYTMGDIARFSLKNDGILYDEFGINAELLIDHAWGYEPVTMKDIKNYRSDNHSLGSGQVLMRPYTFEEAKIVTKEMIDNLVLDMVSKDLVTDHVSLYVGYDSSNSTEGYVTRNNYYGKKEIKPSKGSMALKDYTSSTDKIMKAILAIYDQKVDPALLIRRINICADHVVLRSSLEGRVIHEQLDLFTSLEEKEIDEQKEKEADLKEKKMQEAILLIKKKHGKNKILKGTSYEEAATGRARNAQIGGHRE
ncbi:MAG: DNA methylase [Erysipelotrichaceae bacterium]|nr:DNA methylase [Erysipelotrichaceae bacterium]